MRGERGFGLVDVIVATVIGGFVLAAVVGVLVTAFTTLRVADENFKGDDDVQLVLLALTRDVQSATPSNISVDPSGMQLQLGAARPSDGKFVRITYAYVASAGELSRAVDDGSGTVTTTIAARNLKRDHTAPVLKYCASQSDCPSVTGTFPFVEATIPFVVNRADVLRTIKVAPRLGTTP